MKKDNSNMKRIGLALVLTLISFNSLVATPAQATVHDNRVSARLQDERNQLLIEEKRLLQDYDDLQRQIREEKRAGTDPRIVDQLCRDLDNTHNDLKQIEYDLKNVETMLM